MPITTYKVESTVSRQVALPRTCSGCGHSWMGSVTVTASHSTDSSMSGPNEKEKAEARKTALEKLEVAAKRMEAWGDVTREVLCPRCGQFDAGAMKRHFPKGYATGLLGIYRGKIWSNLVLFVLCVLGFLIVVSVALSILTSKEARKYSELVFLSIGALALIFSVSLSFGAYKCARKFGITSANSRNVRAMIEATSDAYRLALVVDAYRKNKNSLSGDAWIDVLTAAGKRHRKGQSA